MSDPGNSPLNSPEQIVNDLFDYGAPTYPAFLGAKGSATSHEAAEKVAPFAKTLRCKVAAKLAHNL